MRSRGTTAVLVATIALLAAGCGDSGDEPAAYGKPFTLPVGATEWKQVPAPSWFDHGTLHVGKQTLELGDRVDFYVLGRTGVYWMDDETLMFTDTEGATQEVAEVVWTNMAVSADRTVFATVDQSRGPTDRYGAHVMQVAAFDTTTGEQLYRTPDEEPDKGADLAAGYSDSMPLLEGVSDELLFYAGRTIHLDDGSSEPSGEDSEGVQVYAGMADTLFADGFHVGIRGNGKTRELAESELYGVGRLSPDRSTIIDVSQWPATSVAYDAETGRQRMIRAPWRHFSFGGFTDEDTFYGVAEQVDLHSDANPVRARQVVSCELDTLACTPLSPVLPTQVVHDGDPAYFLVEGSADQL